MQLSLCLTESMLLLLAAVYMYVQPAAPHLPNIIENAAAAAQAEGVATLTVSKTQVCYHIVLTGKYIPSFTGCDAVLRPFEPTCRSSTGSGMDRPGCDIA